MTIHLGNVPAGSTLYIPFTTYNAAGASVTLTGLAVTDIEIYKDGSVTQRASDAGYALLDTDGIDFDGITGIHGFSVDLADDTTAGFYAVGSFYWVVVSAVTIDAQTVNFIAATFRVVAAEAVAGKPKVDVDAWLGTAAATPTVAGVPEMDVTHFNGTAGTFAAGIPEVKVASLAANAINAAAIATDALSNAKFADGALTAAKFAAGSFDAVWSVAARLLTAGTNIALAKGTGVTGFTDLSAAAVNAEVDTALSDYDGPTNAELATALGTADDAVLAAIAALNNLSAAGVRTAVGLASANLDTQLADLPTNAELATALGTADDAVLTAIDAVPTANENADALLDRAAGIETNRTVRQGFRLMIAALMGKASGLEGTTATYRDTNDGVNRIVATVDANGNRSAVTLDAS